MRNSKLLCAISHGLYSPWLDILNNGQEKTWLTEVIPDGISILHFHGKPLGKFGQSLDRIHERIRWTNRYMSLPLSIIDEFFGFPFKKFTPSYSPSQKLATRHAALQINSIDAYVTYRWKLLGLFRYFLEETSNNFLLLTTTSSYINLDKLWDFIETLPDTRVYVGSLSYPGAKFVSGSNRILSRDVVSAVYSNMTSWRIGTIEDLELGRLIKTLLGIDPTTFPIINIETLGQLDNLDSEIFLSNYHFRLKSGNLKNRNDVGIMVALHKKLLANRESS